MIKFNVVGAEYQLVFEYGKFEKFVDMRESVFAMLTGPGFTSSVRVHRHHLDPQDWEYGRRQAIDRLCWHREKGRPPLALLDKETRTALWKAYLASKQCKTPAHWKSFRHAMRLQRAKRKPAGGTAVTTAAATAKP